MAALEVAVLAEVFGRLLEIMVQHIFTIKEV
jgi:hypothetical protein